MKTQYDVMENKITGWSIVNPALAPSVFADKSQTSNEHLTETLYAHIADSFFSMRGREGGLEAGHA